MPNLKDLKIRINSVQSTRKITAAMKMVAAAKLRRAQDAAVAARPYAERMERMIAALADNVGRREGAPRMIAGTGKQDVHLLVVATADRGLCGAFNSSIVREARRMIRRLASEGRTIKILCVGRKGRDQLRREFASMIVGTIEDVAKPRLTFPAAERVAQKVAEMFKAGDFDVATIIYNRFKSAISQIITIQQIVPVPMPDAKPAKADTLQAIYEYEPEEDEILAVLLPRNLSTQVFRALLENAASEQGARMTAMDNATRNAGEMIGKLTQTYNRSRQAYITKELIEIISGAEAV
jgi:F-type H+-transporting ATPase subunit gamma